MIARELGASYWGSRPFESDVRGGLTPPSVGMNRADLASVMALLVVELVVPRLLSDGCHAWASPPRLEVRHVHTVPRRRTMTQSKMEVEV
jgi:hypothetical protein